ncbi:MAG: hypothetical protein M1820_006751 [Bogoriella megaspora]|nr:MAG: hypothetical protein M1820_006751 [Bogoriella megaspora]
MSGFFRPRNLAVAGGAISILFLVPQFSGANMNMFNTHASQSVTDRFNSGGGAGTHTPGVATKRGTEGDPKAIDPPHGRQGPDSEKFRDNIESQRVTPQNPVSKAFAKHTYGNEKGR